LEREQKSRFEEPLRFEIALSVKDLSHRSCRPRVRLMVAA
jgi:hypothetical protein